MSPRPQPKTLALVAQEDEVLQTIASLPSLRSYTVPLSNGNHQSIPSINSLAPIHSHLARLRLQILDIADNIARRLLPAVPHIVDLYIEDPSNTSPGIGVVALAPADEPVDVELVYERKRLPLPHLETLSLRGPRVVSLILGNFKAPNLARLALSGGVAKRDVLLDFLDASTCTLRNFSLHPATSSLAIAELFLTRPEHWVAVTSLTIELHAYKPCVRWDESSAALIDVLTWRFSGLTPDIFPSLTSLELAGPRSSISPVIDLLESRRVLGPSGPSTNTTIVARPDSVVSRSSNQRTISTPTQKQTKRSSSSLENYRQHAASAARAALKREVEQEERL